MAQAARDQNFVPTLLGVSSIDYSTPTTVAVDPTTHALVTDVAISIAPDVNIAKFGGSTVAIGQQLASVSIPVILPAATITTLTPLSSVAVNNASGGSAVNIQDGGNSITVDGAVTISGSISNTSFAATIADGADVTLGAKADAKSTATDTTPISVVSVLKEISAMAQAPASTPVTGTFWQATQPVSGTVTANAGTNLNTSALAVESGGNLATIGAAIISQEATTLAVKGITAFGAVTTNAPSYTTAKSDALSLDTSGLLRISLKDTPANTNKFLVTADAITFASPQHIIADSGTITTVSNLSQIASTTPTFNSSTFSGKSGLDVNVLGTLGTAFSTAGKVDVKGADGDVFVRQTSAANLLATVSIASAQTLATVTTVSTVSNLSQIASTTPTFGDVNNSAAEAGSLDVAPIGRYNATLPTITDTRYNQFQIGLRGALQVNLLNTDGTATQFLASAALGDGAAANPTTTTVGDIPLLMNATTVDRARAVINTLDSTGIGIAAVGIVGQFDDTSPTAATENKFDPIRISSRREMYTQIRDAAGNERGVNVTSANELLTNVNNTVTVGTHAVTQSGNWTSRIVGNAGGLLDATVGPATAPANMLAVGGLFNNATPPAPTDGQSLSTQLDQAGNLRIAPGVSLKTLSAWTSATSLNATQTIFTNSGVEAVVVQLVQTSTLSAGAVSFEVTYDNSNWVTIPADAVLDPSNVTFAQISLPYTVQASTNKPFILTGKGWQGLRVKLTTQITGSGSVTPNYALLPYAPADSVIAYSPTAANFNVTATIQTNAAVNVAQINGATPLMDVGASGSGAQRVVQVNNAGKTLVSKGGSVASSGDNTLVSAGTNKLKVYAFSLSTTSTTSVTAIFQSGAAGTELWRVVLQAPTSVSTGANLAVTPPAWLFATASATLLNLNLSSAQTVHYSVSYYDEA